MRREAKKNAKVLSEEQIAELKRQAGEVLAATRRNLMSFYPFVGNVALSLDLVPIRDCRCDTACTDGSAIYFDIDFLNSLSNDDKMFILAHEVYHNVMLHAMRRETRDHVLFNYATDIEVNEMLHADGLSMPESACTAAKFNLPKGKSAEEYYELLLDMRNRRYAAFEEIAKLLDRHIDKDEEIEETGNENLEDKFGRILYDEDFRPNVTESAVENVRESAVAAATQIERMRGEVPDHLKGLINKLLEPKLDWRELLAKFVTAGAGEKRTWSRLNHRFAGRGIYLPSTRGDKLKIAVGIDTSASVSSLLPRFLGELNGLVNNFDYELHVIQCDADVKNHTLYDENNPLDLINTKYEVQGFGGTKLSPIFDFIERNELDIDACVVLTDGYCEKFSAEMAPNFPVMWCVAPHGCKTTLSFGEVVDLDD